MDKNIIKIIKVVDKMNQALWRELGALDSCYEVHTDGNLISIVFIPVVQHDDQYTGVWSDTDGPFHTKKHEFRKMLEEHWAEYLGLKKHKCETCDGTGISPDEMADCDQCDGCGWYEGGPTIKTECKHCNGTGKIAIKKDEKKVDN